MKKYKKIVILDSVILYPEHRYRLNQLADEITEYNTCNTEEEVLERVKGADCVISCWVDITNRVIDENPQIKTIAFWTHAYEHRIDKKYAESHGIYVPFLIHFQLEFLLLNSILLLCLCFLLGCTIYLF